MTYKTNIDKLREEWVKRPDKRQIIEMQAKILKWREVKRKTDDEEEQRILLPLL